MNDAFFRFLNRSPTSWHAARETSERLAEAEFIPLLEQESWKLEKGKSYFVQRDDAAIAAFRLPKKTCRRAILLACHLDSPCLKIKPVPNVKTLNMAQFSTEVYGSPLLHTWLDRDLAVAGRIVVRVGERKEKKLVFLDDYPLIIPSLALHLNRSLNEQGLKINKQEHLRPIAALSQKPELLKDLLHRHIPFDDLISFDLFLTPLEKPSYLGVQGEMISSARLDNLTSAFAVLHAMIGTERQDDDVLQLAIFFDHEEIGSRSWVGAESAFLSDLLERIASLQNISGDDFYCFKSRSWCISVDLAHGYHPNFPECYDMKNAPLLGGGVVLKMNAQQRYATSATSAAPLIEICHKKGIPWQTFAMRSDLPCGGTVGSIISAACGISTVDIGIAGWAMHSIRETVSTQDQISQCQLLKEVLHDAPES